jgi:hypothetical protein
MPTPHVEEPERFPGGADALADQARYGEIPDTPMGVDLPPDLQPHVDLPEGVVAPDDKQQEPDEADLDAPEPPA